MSSTTQTTLEVIVESPEEEEVGEDDKRCPRCGDVVSKYRYAVHLGNCDEPFDDVGGEL